MDEFSHHPSTAVIVVPRERISTMLSEAELKEWMQKHLRYEWLMTQQTHAQLHRRLDQMTWNTNFSAFALHARNLQWFLTNNPGHVLPKKVRACNYVSHFKADDSKIANIMWDLHEEVYHPGSQRLGATKTGRHKVDEVFAWVKEWMDKFVREIQKTTYKSAWDPDSAHPSKVAPTSAKRRVDSNNPPPVKFANILSQRRRGRGS